jgi:hypothetical protein
MMLALIVAPAAGVCDVCGAGAQAAVATTNKLK